MVDALVDALADESVEQFGDVMSHNNQSGCSFPFAEKSFQLYCLINFGLPGKCWTNSVSNGRAILTHFLYDGTSV